MLAAHISALEQVLKDHGQNLSTIRALEALKARANPVAVPHAILKSYTGSYGAGTRRISYEKGKLYVQRAGESKYELIPLTMDTFYIQETPFLHIKMNIENAKTIDD